MLRSPLVALLALLACAASPRPAVAFTPEQGKMPMTVTLVRSDAASCGADCPEWLALTGTIGAESPGRLAAALARLGKRRVPILLDSPGGDTAAGLAMSRAIRARGLDTAVATTTLVPCEAADAACRARERAGTRLGHLGPPPGENFAPVCASSCVLVLAGGVARAVAPGAFVGVHQAKRVLTYHPVVNTFRVLSRTVDGRKVEVSRTLVATRALPVKVVTQAAPQSVYDEFERNLIKLGIDESIVPLMRETPPSGIHWMTAAELASTRIITTTEDARTLLVRTAAPPAAPAAPATALAAAKLGDGARVEGAVDWRVTEDGEPGLAGTVDIPERHLHGTLLFRRDTKPGSPGGIVASADFGPPAAIEAGRTWTVDAPIVCDAAACLQPFLPDADDGAGRRAFRVTRPGVDALLSALRGRDWVSLPLSGPGGAKGWISVSVKDGARPAVARWERLCCDVTGGDGPPVVPPTDETPAVSWSAQPDGRALRGTVDLRGAGLRLTLVATPTPRGASLALDAAGDPERFGPLNAVEVEPVRDGSGLTAATGGARRERPDAFTIDLAARAPVPAGARLGLALVDARGRKLAVAVPLPKPIVDMLGAQARPRALSPARAAPAA